MKKQNFLICHLLFCVVIIFAGSCDSIRRSSRFTDSRDGNVYKTVTIGDQVWMAENLRYLPNVVDRKTGSLTTSYYYVYGYNGTDVNEAKATKNYATYGVLYNWTASLSACPAGWHLPSDDEWTELENYLADNDYQIKRTSGLEGVKIAKSLADTSGWVSSTSYRCSIGNTGYPEYRNKSGFTALPGGYRHNAEKFVLLRKYASWWSATDGDVMTAYRRTVNYIDCYVIQKQTNKALGLSVRCLRD